MGSPSHSPSPLIGDQDELEGGLSTVDVIKDLIRQESPLLDAEMADVNNPKPTKVRTPPRRTNMTEVESKSLALKSVIGSPPNLPPSPALAIQQQRHLITGGNVVKMGSAQSIHKRTILTVEEMQDQVQMDALDVSYASPPKVYNVDLLKPGESLPPNKTPTKKSTKSTSATTPRSRIISTKSPPGSGHSSSATPTLKHRRNVGLRPSTTPGSAARLMRKDVKRLDGSPQPEHRSLNLGHVIADAAVKDSRTPKGKYQNPRFPAESVFKDVDSPRTTVHLHLGVDAQVSPEHGSVKAKLLRVTEKKSVSPERLVEDVKKMEVSMKDKSDGLEKLMDFRNILRNIISNHGQLVLGVRETCLAHQLEVVEQFNRLRNLVDEQEAVVLDQTRTDRTHRLLTLGNHLNKTTSLLEQVEQTIQHQRDDGGGNESALKKALTDIDSFDMNEWKALMKDYSVFTHEPPKWVGEGSDKVESAIKSLKLVFGDVRDSGEFPPTNNDSTSEDASKASEGGNNNNSNNSSSNNKKKKKKKKK